MANYVSNHTGAQIDAAVENVGVLDGKVTTLSEEIANLKENGGSGGEGGVSEVEYSVDGQFIEIDGIEGKDVHIVTKFENASTTAAADKTIALTHATSKNLFDFVALFVRDNLLEKTINGVTAVIDPDTSTVHFTGNTTLDSTPMTVVSVGTWSAQKAITFPAGSYSVPKVVGEAEMVVSISGLNSGTAKVLVGENNIIDEPFFVTNVMFKVHQGVIDCVMPIYLSLAGDRLTSYAFAGNVYSVGVTSPVANGTFDWTSGELKDESGNVVQTVVTPEIVGLPGVNKFIGAKSSIEVSGIKTTSGSGNGGTTVHESFDPYVWGLPVLALEGSTDGMNKDDAVELAYNYDGRVGTCTCKWQGSSSLAYKKKNYTIKFDKAFEAAEGWGEQKKYCFKANYIDHSHCRNVVNAKLWGQIVKSRNAVPAELENLVNGGAVDGFPVIITLNGEFHGLYTMNIPKDGWMLGMDSGTNEAILCADKWVDATRFKAEALCDGSDFELEYVTNEDDAGWVATSVNRAINACINSDGSDLDTTVAQYLDWQSAIDYYIFAVLVAGEDMTCKNYLLYTFDGTKWYFGAYDMDCTHGLTWDGNDWLGADNAPTFAGYANMHRVMELIKTYKKDELNARYAELRETVMSESNVAKTFGNFAGRIPSPVYMQDVKKWPMIPNTAVNNVSQIRDYYRMRVALADKWMEQL